MTSKPTSLVRGCAVAAVAMALSFGISVPAEAAQSRENYPGGESAFKTECRMAGGRFERAVDGKVRCYFDSGWVIVCDRGAKNCRSFDQNMLTGGSSMTYTGPTTFSLAR